MRPQVTYPPNHIRRQSSVTETTESKAVSSKDAIRIFVLSYSASTFEIAKKEFTKYSWAYPLLLENASINNPIYENMVYNKFDTLIKPLTASLPYIGFLSYKATRKIDVKGLDYYIRTQQYLKYDATFFWVGSNMTSNVHPNFQEIWRDCIESKVGPCRLVRGCFGNFWCAKTTIMDTYAKYFASVLLPCLLKHPKINTDARYKNQMTKEDLMKLASYPYHTHIPFILERIPNAWCMRNNFKISYSTRC
jgi:hypothetical protein